MRAMVVRDYESPLELMELPLPEVMPGSVLVRVLTCGVCYSDVKTARGQGAHRDTLPLPHVPGHEICGQIAHAGRNTGFREGDRVIVYNYWSCGECDLCRMDLEHLCENMQGRVGFTVPGGFQEYVAVPAHRLLHLPDGISPEQAAPSSCALGTSFRAVITRGQVRPGMTVVIQGVGGVGLNSLQVARAAGAQVVAVDIDSRHLQMAAQLGAAKVTMPEEHAREAVSALTHGLGADVLIDTVGREDSLMRAAQLVRPEGRVVGVGYTVGALAQIPINDFVGREIEFVGSRYVRQCELEQALRMLANGQVRNVIDDVLPLEKVNQAFTKLEQGNVVGRVVLRVAEP